MGLDEAERDIAKKISAFQGHISQARWNDLVMSCYAPEATLSHFMAPEVLAGRNDILSFFQKNSSGYDLDLLYAITELESDPSARLVAGVGSVSKGPWCCFAERWEMIDGVWLIVQDKVYAPEVWMK